jgi:PAS domain S-box-containing protein
MVTKDLNKKLDGLTQILGVIADPVIVVDSAGQVIAANNIIGKYTYPAEQLVDKNLFELKLFNKEQAAIIKENIGKRLKGNQVDPYEVTLKGKNGQEAALEVNAKKVEYNGQLLDFIVLRDVTQRTQERKELQTVLKKSEKIFKTISESTFDGIIFFDAKEKIRYWNNAAQEIYGYTKDEILGKKLKETIIAPSAFDFFTKTKTDFLKKKTGCIAFEIPTLRKDGTELPAEISLNITKIGEEELVVASIRDNSEHRNSEERFNGIARSIKDAVILVDDEARITYWNPAAEKTFGYTSQEALDRGIHELVMPDSTMTKERMAESIKAFSETGIGYFTVGNVEVMGRRKDGTKFPAELSVSPMKSDGKWNAVGVVKDITRRKTSNQKLWDAEQRYHMLFSQAPVGVMVIDPETAGFTEFNDITHLQLGYTREELEKLTLVDIRIDESLDLIKNNIARIIQRGGGEFETSHRTKTGEIRTVIITCKPFKNQGKNYIHCIAHDITESKKTQDALAASETRYRQLVEVAQEGIWAIDNDFVTTFINPRMAKMLGYKENEIMGKSLMEFVDPAWANRIGGIIKDFNREGAEQYEYSFPHKNGSHIDTIVTLSVIFDEKKHKIGSLAVISDVTERKQLERDLRQERDLLESVTASTNMILAIITPEYRIAWANKTAKLLTNACENQYCYKTFGDGSPNVCEGCGVKRVFENGENIVRRDYSFIKNGKLRWSELISTPIKDKNGEIVAALEISIDITERKQLQNKLADYSQRLEEIVQKRTDELKRTQAELVKSERLAAIGELAGMIGHDLRNPLTGIKNSAYYLKKKGLDISAEQSDEMLEIIDKCVNYSNRIINDLLDYSKEIHLSLEEQTPKKMLKDALTIIVVPEKITIDNRLRETPEVWVDPDKLKRVFINLIKNAVDAMPGGGTITLESKKVGRTLEVSFTDTGSGISDEVLPKLFTPLCTTKAQGMGFGLAICKRIIEAHKGAISVKTVKGQGTTFTITIPLDLKVEDGGETHG